MTIDTAITDDDIRACYPVMAQLRPGIAEADFLPLVRRLGTLTGLRLAALRDDDGTIRSVAGYRVSEWLAGGRYLEIEDLVSAADARSQGYGGRMFDWLVDVARQAGCRQVRLVSATHRLDAHRFYQAKGMAHTANYFALDV